MCIFIELKFNFCSSYRIFTLSLQHKHNSTIMKKQLLITLLTLMTCMGVSAQVKVYGVGFYNLENLFDYEHDEGKNDYQYLPDGSYKWNEFKYAHKLHNMATVLSELGTDMLPNIGCAVIGVSEVENARCLTDLCAQPELAARGYQFCHIEGPDRRGVDCALLYNPALFTVRNVKLVPYIYELEKDSARATRGFLTVSGTLADEHVTIIVAHLPSRFSGSYYRELGGKQMRAVKDSVLRDDPNCKIFVMGDMNDDPNNKSMYDALGAKENIDKIGPDEMYNPFYDTLIKKKTGTLQYDGKWNLFDQIVMTPNLLNKKGSKDYSTLKFFKNEVFRRDYLFQKEGKYKGGTKRTTAGGVWLDGYSDHLPVCVYLAKNVQ